LLSELRDIFGLSSEESVLVEELVPVEETVQAEERTPLFARET
jgi:hypothetical protein